MTSYIHEEVKQGTLSGPFDGNPFSSQAIVSPLSTREKRDSTDRRVIMDFSFPPGQSVNDKIQKGTYLEKECELTYPSVDALVELVKKNGEGCLMMKRDLKRAYKQIQTDPADWNLLGLIWTSSGILTLQCQWACGPLRCAVRESLMPYVICTRNEGMTL